MADTGERGVMEALIQQYGLDVVVIATMAGVIVFLYKKIEKLTATINELQEKRLADAISYRDTLTEPLNRQIELGKKTYDLLFSFNQRGK